MSQLQQVSTISNQEYLKKFVSKDWAIYQSSKGKSKLNQQEKRSKFIVENIAKAMEKYDESWWLSDDLSMVAYHQMNERVLLVSFEKFKKSVSFVLGREIFAENAIDLLKYKKEVNMLV